MYYLEITANCHNFNFDKIYALFGVNSFHLKSWLCKILDIKRSAVVPLHLR